MDTDIFNQISAGNFTQLKLQTVLDQHRGSGNIRANTTLGPKKVPLFILNIEYIQLKIICYFIQNNCLFFSENDFHIWTNSIVVFQLREHYEIEKSFPGKKHCEASSLL